MNDPDEMSDQELSRLLRAAEPVEPSPALRRAVAEIPLRHPASATASLWPWRSVWQALASALAVAALGVAVGALTPQEAEADEQWNDYSSLALAETLDEELTAELDPSTDSADADGDSAGRSP